MNNKDIKLVLFDLGGVLVELGDSMFPDSWFPDEAGFGLNDWFSSDIAIKFETGLASPELFIQSLKAHLSLDASEESVLEAFRMWPIGLFPDTDSLLERLNADYKIAVLSNSNEIHEPRIMQEFGLQDRVNDIFFSHIIGCSKPNKEAFKHVLKSLAYEPGEVMFFDDNTDNVATARQLGIHAFVVNSPLEVNQYI